MKKISNAILLAGGFDPSVVAQAPRHFRIRYYGYGMAILVTCTAAFFGALHTGLAYFSNWFFALLLAAVWTLSIGVIEHLIVVYTESRNKKLIAVVRGLASLVFSVIISTPLVLALCQGPVLERIWKKTQHEIDAKISAFEAWKSENQRKVLESERLYVSARKEADLEAAGGGPSHKFGADGPITKRMDATAKVLEEQWRASKTDFEQALAKRESDLKNARQNALTNEQHDELTMLRELLQLVREDGAVCFRFVTLWMALLFLELLPLVLKLTRTESENDPYIVAQHAIEVEEKMKRLGKENELRELQTQALLAESANATKACLEIKEHSDYMTDAKDSRRHRETYSARLFAFGSQSGQAASDVGNRPAMFPACYRLLITDSEQAADSPFALSTAIANHALALCRDAATDEQRTAILFDFVCNHVTYDTQHDAFLWGYRNAMETFVDKTAICGEMSFFFISLARVAGLRAQYVQVDVDCNGVEVNHACALVNNQMVDISYKLINAEHKICRVLGDAEIEQRFRSWRTIDPAG